MSAAAGVSTGRRCIGRLAGDRALRLGVAVLAVSSVTLVMATPVGATGTQPKPPGQPKNVVAVPIEGGGTISWTAPTSDGGSPITGYTVKAPKGTCSTDGATTCSITGLTDGHGYLARVQAVNAVGTGRVSAPAHFVAGQSPDCSNLAPGADLRYCRFGNQDLDGLDLAGADLSGARYGHATFAGTDLDGAVFNGTTGKPVVEAADLSGAQLKGASFGGAYVESSDFSDTDLTDADFDGSVLVVDSFDGATMAGADLDGAFWSEVECPDGTLSNDDGNTCVNDLGPSGP